MPLSAKKKRLDVYLDDKVMNTPSRKRIKDYPAKVSSERKNAKKPTPEYRRNRPGKIPSSTTQIATKNRIVCRRGVLNIGNTCYLNSTVQALSHIPSLRDYFLSKKFQHEINLQSKVKGELATQYYRFLKQLWKPTDDMFPPPADASRLKAVMSLISSQFSGANQHDAEEFLISMLNGLHDDLNRVTKRPKWVELDRIPDESCIDLSTRFLENHFSYNNSKIQDLFMGQMKNELLCQHCNMESRNFEVFMNLSVPLPQKKSNRKDLHVLDCIRSLLAEERLSGINSVYCSHCRTHQPFKKKLSLFRLPKVLILSFKRFEITSSKSKKLNSPVKFPKKSLLDLSEFIDVNSPDLRQSCKYQLRSVVSHSGTLNSGHYKCFSSDTNSEWYCYNDSLISKVSPSNISSSDAYILVLERIFHTE